MKRAELETVLAARNDAETKRQASDKGLKAWVTTQFGASSQQATEFGLRLDLARKDARFAAPVATLFRSKTPDASTDEELQALLLQIELLAKLETE